LHGMEERLTLLGGKLTIKSSPGTGTRLTAEIPIEDSL
jgi:signal transduction histidine kinase